MAVEVAVVVDAARVVTLGADVEVTLVGVKIPGSVGRLNGAVPRMLLYFAVGRSNARYPCFPPPSQVGTS